MWDRLAPDLIDKGCLTAWDVDLFVVYCDAAATYHECRRAIGDAYTTKGSVRDTTVKSPLWRIMRDCADTMRTIGGKFGLTPSDRAGIDTSQPEETSKYGPERILGEPGALVGHGLRSSARKHRTRSCGCMQALQPIKDHKFG